MRERTPAGYLQVLGATFRRHGVPVALYRHRHGIFESSDTGRLTLEEELIDPRVPTRWDGPSDELGVTSFAARSPPAKGGIELGHAPGPPGGRAAAGRRARP